MVHQQTNAVLRDYRRTGVKGSLTGGQLKYNKQCAARTQLESNGGKSVAVDHQPESSG